MSESTDHLTQPAGWYADPAGTPRQRWWDGTAWTEHLHDPALEVYGAVRPSIVGPQTPVYNWFIWTLTLLPLLSTAASASIDMTAYLSRSLLAPASSNLPDPYGWIEWLGWLIYAVVVVLAYFDRRRLLRDGFVRPFHWAWAFLATGAVYIIGRSVIVRRRAGRGQAPIWVFATTMVISVAVFAAQMTQAMSVIIPMITSDLPTY